MFCVLDDRGKVVEQNLQSEDAAKDHLKDAGCIKAYASIWAKDGQFYRIIPTRNLAKVLSMES